MSRIMADDDIDFADAEATMCSASDEDYDADDADDDKEYKDGLQMADKEEQRHYNAFICSNIDETWVGVAELKMLHI